MHSGEPLVSVIMPVYNCQAYVGDAINSILTQTYQNWELMIGDDGSTDHTADIVRNYKDPRLKVVFLDSNHGAGVVRNRLISASKGEFIAFQDADDVSAENRIAVQLQALLSHPDVGMVGCQLAYVDTSGRTLRISENPLTYSDVIFSIYKRNVFCGPTMMLRRTAIDSVGGYREFFNRLSNEDYDLSLLIAQRYECYNVPDLLYYYRQHEKSASKIINIERVLAREVAAHLALQRKNRGFDDLQSDHPEKVNAFMEALKVPYRSDPSLIFREYASNFMFEKIYRRAILASIDAIAASPSKAINYRTLLYCVRKSLFK